jgi:hypothetical protein
MRGSTFDSDRSLDRLLVKRPELGHKFFMDYERIDRRSIALPRLSLSV